MREYPLLHLDALLGTPRSWVPCMLAAHCAACWMACSIRTEVIACLRLAVAHQVALPEVERSSSSDPAAVEHMRTRMFEWMSMAQSYHLDTLEARCAGGWHMGAGRQALLQVHVARACGLALHTV